MLPLLDRYSTLLQEVDQWFSSCRDTYGTHLACRSGCSACCRGLFDITLLDALLLKKGFDLLPADAQKVVRSKAGTILNMISSKKPDFNSPWLLNAIPEPEWDDIMPDDDETPCVLLSDEGNCLAYAYRPMTCRLNGIPLIDLDGEELFDEWCTLNFIDADPRLMKELRHPFKSIFAQELLLMHVLTRKLLGKEVSELDTIIPAAVFLHPGMLTKLPEI